jgi:hypothetical protein
VCSASIIVLPSPLTGGYIYCFADVFEDISLNQWLALTPAELVKAHLGLSDATIKKLSKTKLSVVGPK